MNPRNATHGCLVLVRIACRLADTLLILLMMGLALVGCSGDGNGEKLGLAQGGQVIGHTEDGGGIGRGVSDLMRMVGLKLNRHDQSEPEPRERLKVPEVRDFGELGPDFKWDPENDLTEKEVQPHLEKARLWRFDAYRLYIWRGGDFEEAGEGIALYHHSTLAYVRKGHFSVTNPEAEDDDDFYMVKGPAPGADIDRDGLLDLLIYEHSGGQHCCWTVQHLECGPPC